MDDSGDGDNENEDRNDNVLADTNEEEEVVVQNGRCWEVVEIPQLVLLFLFHGSVGHPTPSGFVLLVWKRLKRTFLSTFTLLIDLYEVPSRLASRSFVHTNQY